MPYDTNDLKSALELVEYHAQQAADYGDTLRGDFDALTAQNQALQRDVESLNRAADELRAVINGHVTKSLQQQGEIRVLENKLAVAEMRMKNGFAVSLGRALYNLAKTYPIGARDLIVALQDTVDHLDGDEVGEIKEFTIPPAAEAQP